MSRIERLDPALTGPGQRDVWVNFTRTHGTKWQAEGIFRCFFPYKPSAVWRRQLQRIRPRGISLPKAHAIYPFQPHFERRWDL